MGSIKEFLNPGNKGLEKRNLAIIYLFGVIFIFFIGFVASFYLTGSILMSFTTGMIGTLPFLAAAILLYLISLVGINKEWSKNTWRVVCIVMIVIGLLLLLLRYL